MASSPRQAGWPAVDANARDDVDHGHAELTAQCGGIVPGRSGFDDSRLELIYEPRSG